MAHPQEAPQPRAIERLRPEFRETINPRAALGFIGLATDRPSFPDFRDFIAPYAGVEAHATRIPFCETATRETLAAMGAGLRDGAALLTPGQPLGSISYSCTSGTIAIGPETVRREIQAVRPDVPVATPIGAAVAGLAALGARRITLLTPYLIDTTEMVATYLESEGFALDHVATFDLEGDPQMNRLDPECLTAAARAVCRPESDALFISCTGLRTHALIAPLEAALGRPVVTSNQALAWRALRLAGVEEPTEGQGGLFKLPG